MSRLLGTREKERERTREFKKERESSCVYWVGRTLENMHQRLIPFKKIHKNHTKNIKTSNISLSVWRGIVFSVMRLSALINRLSLCFSHPLERGLRIRFPFVFICMCRKWPRLSVRCNQILGPLMTTTKQKKIAKLHLNLWFIIYDTQR